MLTGGPIRIVAGYAAINDDDFDAEEREAVQAEGCNPREIDALAYLIDDVTVLAVPEPPMLVDGRLPTDGLGALIGAPGIGKSLVGLGLSVAVATGTPWLGANVLRSGPVVWVLAEGGIARFGRRIRAAKLRAGCGLETRIGLYTWPGPVTLSDRAALTRLVAAVRATGAALVVLDTYSRVAGGADENSAGDTARIVAALDELRTTTGALVLALHHLPKDGRLEPRGSTALAGAVDTILTLSRAGDGLRLACGKQRDAAPFAPLNLKLVPSDDSVVPVLDETPGEGPGLAGDTLNGDLLRALANGPCSGSRLATQLHQDRALVFSRLRRLEGDGLVRQEGAGRSTRWSQC